MTCPPCMASACGQAPAAFSKFRGPVCLFEGMLLAETRSAAALSVQAQQQSARQTS
jgi:hypothetical protein